jgi:DNA repair protein RecO (recombination protein O)
MLIEDRAFILFSRPQGETSVWLSVLTQYHGRLSLVYKGGRKKSASCAPFMPLVLTWKATARGMWLSGCEADGFHSRLTGMANWSGLYVNELLHKGLNESSDSSEMFLAYERLLLVLRQANTSATQMALALRRFEWQFLRVLGYGFPLIDVTGAAIEAQGVYRWHQDAWQISKEGIGGAQLLVLEQGGDEPVCSQLRQLLQWRLCQVLPTSAMAMRQWWEQLG